MKLVIVVSILALSNYAHAARFDISTEIGKIRHHELTTELAPSWQGSAWFTLKNPDLNGVSPNCPKDFSEYTLTFSASDKNLLSMLLSAKMAGKTVTVTFDDTFKINTKCKLQYFTID